MKEVKILRVYNLLDSKGNKLQLRLGLLHHEDREIYNDTGYRWSFIGTHIPMPVRAQTWFNGFPEETMLDWLKGNGWYMHTRVEMSCGHVQVYELPKGDEESEEFPAHYYLDKSTFNDAIRFLYNNGKRITAVRTYRYAHGGKLCDAGKAVREIVDEQP